MSQLNDDPRFARIQSNFEEIMKQKRHSVFVDEELARLRRDLDTEKAWSDQLSKSFDRYVELVAAHMDDQIRIHDGFQKDAAALQSEIWRIQQAIEDKRTHISLFYTAGVGFIAFLASRNGTILSLDTVGMALTLAGVVFSAIGWRRANAAICDKRRVAKYSMPRSIKDFQEEVESTPGTAVPMTDRFRVPSIAPTVTEDLGDGKFKHTWKAPAFPDEEGDFADMLRKAEEKVNGQ